MTPRPEPSRNLPPDELHRLVDDLFDRELDPAARAKLFRELRGNLPLATHMERTQAVIDALREAPPAPDLSQRVVREWQRRRTMPKLRRVAIAASAQVATEVVKPWWQAATPWAAAACVTIAFVGVVVYRWGGQTAPAPRMEPREVPTMVAAPPVTTPTTGAAQADGVKSGPVTVQAAAPAGGQPAPQASAPKVTAKAAPRMMPGLQAGTLSNRLLTQSSEPGFVLLGGSGVSNTWRPTVVLERVHAAVPNVELPAYLMAPSGKTFPVVSQTVGLWNEPTIVNFAPVGEVRPVKAPTKPPLMGPYQGVPTRPDADRK